MRGDDGDEASWPASKNQVGQARGAWELDRPREERGVFGLHAPREDGARLPPVGLHPLRGRGRESAALATSAWTRDGAPRSVLGAGASHGDHVPGIARRQFLAAGPDTARGGQAGSPVIVMMSVCGRYGGHGDRARRVSGYVRVEPPL